MARAADRFFVDWLDLKCEEGAGMPPAAPSLSVSNALIVEKVRKGLPVHAFSRLREAMDLPAERLARLIHIPLRTLARRRVFKIDESERIVRLGRLFQRALEVLGSEEEARRWLGRSQKALGNIVPLDFADTEPGAREVEDLLGRLEHGVFS